tara:strand:+ start:72 stop:380 length:309 start_codon:yes stop_codon:yes gene_type:complete
MVFGGLLAGLILIVVGFSVKKNPSLLAGYNTLSKEKKEEIDINKLTTITKNTLVTTGVCVILINMLLNAFEIKESTQLYTICALVLFGVIYITVQSNRLKTK